jgi:Sulfotransferase family
MIDSRRLAFVGGLHRSGTTPFARTLATHPEVSGLTATGVTEDEGQHLQALYPPARTYGGAGRFALDPRAHLTEDSPSVSPQNAARLLDAWLPFWDLERRVLVEKSPPNLIMGRFLQGLFPEAVLIMVLRHPIVVALGTVKWRRRLARRPQNYVSVTSMIDHWFTAHELFLSDLPQLRRTLVVRYEDLIAHPASELARVAQLLQLTEPIDPSRLVAGRSERYVDDWATMQRAPVRRDEAKRIIERYAEPMRRYGYDALDLTANLPHELVVDPDPH